MLRDLQGNILKSHGRDHAAYLFLHFDDSHKARAFLGKRAGEVKSAEQQLIESKVFKETGQPAGIFLALFLSYAGYKALGVDKRNIPSEKAFQGGMKERGARLADSPAIAWDEHFQREIHAMLLIADDSAATVEEHQSRLSEIIERHGGVRIIGVEIGGSIKSENGKNNIEHFGYIDGISIPVMLVEDLPRASQHWNPEAPLELALVRDPGGQSEHSFGSYFVFRKLEQNVRAFKEAEERLAHELGLVEEDAERAGAMLIGRFEDGTPLVLSQEDGYSPEEPANDFTYAIDPHGQRCPFHAHIRKVNPRGESPEQERAHLVVRRGMTYGERADDPNADLPPEARPTGGVGLLFMAYQRSIEQQFEWIQIRWANDPNYVRPNTGLDPVIGQQAYQWPVRWGEDARPKSAPFSMSGLVTLKGGEYFFAPSISFLKSLSDGRSEHRSMSLQTQDQTDAS